jgi:hypothetical protein
MCKLKYCLQCGNKIKSSNKFCSVKCNGKYKHISNYNNYIKNPKDFNNGNYIPKNFKDFFMIEQDYKCKICGIKNEWNDQLLIFVCDHIDGDCSNNIRENIRMICPNCDSQTPTFKSKNKKSKRRNYWKEKIINDINNKK